MGTNEEFLDIQIRRAIHLERFKASLSHRAQQLLLDQEGELETRLRRNLDSFQHGQGKERTKRLGALLLFLEATRRKHMGLLRQELTEEARDLAIEEARFQVESAREVLGPVAKIKVPTPGELRTQVTHWPALGAVLGLQLKSLAASDIERIQREVRLGVFQGEGTQAVVQRVLGTAASQKRDGATGQTRIFTDAVVLTTINGVINATREAVWGLNPGLIEGLRWTSILDNRTSAICRARDGDIYPLNSGPRPPAHYRCRSVMTAWFAGGGAVPRQTYQEWLRQQSVPFQDDVLGKAKGRLFRSGGLTLDKFVNRNTGREFNLKELRRMEPAAFRAAGL